MYTEPIEGFTSEHSYGWQSFDVSIDNVPAGDYYLWLFMDDADEIEESDETNNSDFVLKLITIEAATLPDIEITTVDIRVLDYKELDFDFEISNIGDAEVKDDFKIAAFLEELNTGELFFLEEITFYNGLNAGETVSIEDNIVNYSDVPEGEYYLTLVVDNQKEIAESDENNNSGTDPISFRYLWPELFTTNVNYTIKNKKLEYSFDLHNAGGACFKDIECVVYLIDKHSKKEYYLEEFLVIDYIYYDSTYQTGLLIADISNIPKGDYYLAVYIDNNGKIKESNEDNNFTQNYDIIKIENLLPDLIITKIEWTDVQGEDIYYDVVIKNIGTATSSEPFTLDFYLANNTQEYFVQTIEIDEVVEAGKTFIFSGGSVVADGIPSGDYEFWGLIDDNDKIEVKNL